MSKAIFIMTNFNNSTYTRKYVESIERSDLKGSIIIVVDNCSNDSEYGLLCDLGRQFPLVKIIRNHSNIGYFAGLNVGIEYVVNSLNQSDSILMVGNNDLVFPSDIGSMLEQVEAKLHRYPVISPAIVTSDGIQQNPHVVKRISRIREFIYDVYHFNYHFSRLVTILARCTRLITKRRDERSFEVGQEIYQGYGAFYILSPLFISEFRKLPEDSFLMYEEYFLSYMLDEKGYRVLYDPSVSVTHLCKGATGQLPSKSKWKYSRDSHMVYKEKLKKFKGL